VLEKIDPSNPLDSTADGLDIIDSVVGAGSGYVIDAIAGFGSGSDFLHTRLNDPSVTDISDPNFALDERGGFTVFADSLGAEFLDVSSVRFTGTGANTPHDLVIVPVTSVTPSPESNWDLADSATFRVNILPEPGSMTLLGLGLLGLAGYRRRKVNA
jgi:hypothetical protein